MSKGKVQSIDNYREVKESIEKKKNERRTSLVAKNLRKLRAIDMALQDFFEWESKEEGQE
jgi:hypothetical protein